MALRAINNREENTPAAIFGAGTVWGAIDAAQWERGLPGARSQGVLKRGGRLW
ncbi:MAG: hypothetical protein ACYCYO_01085 [Bacilli bacterium]